MPPAPRLLVALAAVLVAVSVGAVDAGAKAPRDWTRFGWDKSRTSRAPRGLTPEQVGKLRQRRVQLGGTVDSSPIYVSRVRVHGHRHNLIVMTTTYGRTLALDAATGKRLWRFTPSSYFSLRRSAQITTATPVLDPGRRYLFASSPDGFIHKLRVSNGRQVTSGHWPTAVTLDASHEKIASALNLDRGHVLVTTGGYSGDIPPYQGKVVAIARSNGRVVHVLNSLCSHRRRIIRPDTCSAQESAIWGRGGAVVDARTHRIYATSSNGPFDGVHNWADSVLELSPGVGRLLRHYTPTNQRDLEASDADLGSAAPALLRSPGGKRTRYLLQGGKEGKLRLLGMSASLHSAAKAGKRLGGEIQTLPAPGNDITFTAPAVLHLRTKTMAFVATNSATAAYRLGGGQLHRVWEHPTGGTSPVIAGSLLWVYDPGGGLDVYRPGTGRLVRHFDVPAGHWNSPIVMAGRVYVPTGDANDHLTSGGLRILHR